MDGNGSVLTELFFCLVHLTDEIDKTLAHLGDALFRPISELELAYRSRLAVLKTTTTAACPDYRDIYYMADGKQII